MGIFSLSSCKEEERQVNPAQGQKEETNADLILGSWVMKSATVDPGFEFGTGTPITDLYALMDLCSKDDVYIYTADLSLTIDEGPTKCNASDPQTTQGTYELSEDGKTLTQVRNGEVETIEIIALNEEMMEGESPYSDGETDYTITLRFEKI